MNIFGFFAEHRWLSNFWPVVIIYEGARYTSVEAAYQAAKTLNPEARLPLQDLDAFDGKMQSAGHAARKLGKKLVLRSDWDRVKNDVMHHLLRLKFEDEVLRERLLGTGDAYLEETNSWGDTYWGVCREQGENHLGKLLMKVRQEVAMDELSRLGQEIQGDEYNATLPKDPDLTDFWLDYFQQMKSGDLL